MNDWDSERVPLRSFDPRTPITPTFSIISSSSVHSTYLLYPQSYTVGIYVLTCFQFMIAIGLPSGFLILLAVSSHGSGGLVAPEFLVTMATCNPRRTLLIITIISSVFAWLTRNLFSTVISFIARKRSLNWSTFATIEALSALRSGVGLLTWRRPLYSLMTIASAIVFGVLTAAYTTILAPLPIVLSEPLSGWEIDFLATDASCSVWFSDNNLFSFGACGWQNLSGLGVNTCWSSGKRLEIMTAGRSAIVKEFKQQLDQLGSPSLQEVVEIYEMGGSTFYGSTGGAVPQGPASDKHLDTTQSYSRQANSSLDQQGIDISVSCQYINESPMTAFLDQSSSMVNVTGYCPDGQGQTWLLPNSSFIVASLDRPESVSTPNLESHLLYFSNYGTGGSYEIIGNISCEVNGSITTGHLDYNSPPSAFSWNSDGSVETRDQSFRVLENSMDALIYVLETSQSEDGNLFIDAINSIYVPFVMNQTLVTGAPQLSFLSMLETMTRGVLEYEASFLRLIFTLQMLTQTSEFTKTNPCTRPLTGAMQRSTYGWEMNSHALLAFLPIGISGIVLIILFAWVILRMKSSLTYFDPTSLISLAVASSSSSLRFPEGITVDPHDEKARSTSVKFESVSAGEYQFISKPASQWKRAYAL